MLSCAPWPSVCLLWRNVYLVSGGRKLLNLQWNSHVCGSPVQDFVRWQELLFSPSDTSME